MTYEQIVGLEPLPEGTIVACENPYTKTVYFERHTDWGPQRCAPPSDYVLRQGWMIYE